MTSQRPTRRPSHTIRSKARAVVRAAGLAALLVVALSAVVVLTTVVVRSSESILSVRNGIHAVKPILVAAHLALIGALWLLWPHLADRLLARWPDDARAAFCAARHRICFGLLVFELIVVIGLPAVWHPQ